MYRCKRSRNTGCRPSTPPLDAAVFTLQAKDAFGNNRLQGGDDVAVHAVLSTLNSSSSAATVTYRGAVVDNEDGTYLAVYTVPRSGYVPHIYDHSHRRR